MKKGFLFDINKCVACQACVAACQIQNVDLELLVSDKYWKQQVPWRSITTHNEFQHPDLPVFNFSMACNHCEDAPCMSNCPALAYSRDSVFGAVIHQADACIGCQYCTWVCPYDAPKYNSSLGIVEKCTLCVDRLSTGKKPACATSCPTGALNYDAIQLEPQKVIGFTEVGIKPHIQITDLRNSKGPRMESRIMDQSLIALKKQLKLDPKKENKLSKEWPLLIFTLLVPLLVSWFYAAYSKGFGIDKFSFGAALFVSALSSMAHLGKKRRAWRAILNLKSSWLSREILAFMLFIPASLVSISFPNQNELGLLATILGLLVLVSIDNVYRKIPGREKNKYHSADVLFFTAFLYVAIFVGNPWMFFAAATLKGYLYVGRKTMFKKQGLTFRPAFSFLRFSFGFLIPVVLFFVLGFEKAQYMILAFVVLGELIDRAEFYLEL